MAFDDYSPEPTTRPFTKVYRDCSFAGRSFQWQRTPHAVLVGCQVESLEISDGPAWVACRDSRIASIAIEDKDPVHGAIFDGCVIGPPGDHVGAHPRRVFRERSWFHDCTRPVGEMREHLLLSPSAIVTQRGHRPDWARSARFAFRTGFHALFDVPDFDPVALEGLRADIVRPRPISNPVELPRDPWAVEDGTRVAIFAIDGGRLRGFVGSPRQALDGLPDDLVRANFVPG